MHLPKSSLQLQTSGRRGPRLQRSVLSAEAAHIDLHADASYVVTGGTGALGLLTSRWMVEHGARRVVLLSRSGKVAANAGQHWEWLQASEAVVEVELCDVANAEMVREVVRQIHKAAPIRGVVHTAGVLADAMLAEQTEERLQKVWGGKVQGAVNMRRACEEAGCELDMFVLFSSVAALMGAAGQANYAAANAVLDGLAREWRSQGLSAVSVQWGAWAELGMAADAQVLQRLRAEGMRGIGEEEGMRALEVAMSQSKLPVVAMMPVRWKVMLQRMGEVPRFLSGFDQRRLK